MRGLGRLRLLEAISRWLAIILVWMVCVAPGASWAADDGLPASVGLVGDAQTVISTLLGEAQSEGIEGMVAVAEVLRNRAARRGTTMSQEALRPKQFSFWNDRPKATRWLEENATTEQIDLAIHALINAENGSDLTKGATFYYNPALASPGWARKMVETVTISNHRFMKEKA